MQMIFDKEICGEKNHEKDNEKYSGDMAFLGSCTTSAVIFDTKTQTPTLCGVCNKESPQDVL